MRTAIFSDKERKMVKYFLETGEKREGFRVLEYRMRKCRKLIHEDLELMEEYFMELARPHE